MVNVYAPDVRFIELLLRRPQMYTYDKGVGLFDNTLALVFGMRITAKSYSLDDPVVERWENFEYWLNQRYENQPLWATFRAQYQSDVEAMDGLRARYAEFLAQLG